MILKIFKIYDNKLLILFLSLTNIINVIKIKKNNYNQLNYEKKSHKY